MAKRVLKKYDGKKLEWLKLAKWFVLVLVVLFLVFRFVVGVSWVSGESMLPTLKNGAPVFYTRIFNSYEKGDIVYVKMPSGECLVKRIVAVEGDTVDIKDGVLYINGEAENTSYGANTYVPADGAELPITLYAGQIFVVGDNREISVDSRNFGPLSESQIRGKIRFHS